MSLIMDHFDTKQTKCPSFSISRNIHEITFYIHFVFLIMDHFYTKQFKLSVPRLKQMYHFISK